MVVVKAWRLYRVWRRGEAAARLHVRTVGFFSVIALMPAILLAVAGSLTLERVLNPAFMSSVKVFVHNTAEAAAVFRENSVPGAAAGGAAHGLRSRSRAPFSTTRTVRTFIKYFNRGRIFWASPSRRW